MLVYCLFEYRVHRHKLTRLKQLLQIDLKLPHHDVRTQEQAKTKCKCCKPSCCRMSKEPAGKDLLYHALCDIPKADILFDQVHWNLVVRVIPPTKQGELVRIRTFRTQTNKSDSTQSVFGYYDGPSSVAGAGRPIAKQGLSHENATDRMTLSTAPDQLSAASMEFACIARGLVQARPENLAVRASKINFLPRMLTSKGSETNLTDRLSARESDPLLQAEALLGIMPMPGANELDSADN